MAEADGKLAGSVIYLREQGEAYNQVKWPEEIPGDNVYVIHVLAVHPDFFRMGVGTQLRKALHCTELFQPQINHPYCVYAEHPLLSSCSFRTILALSYYL